MFREVIAAIVFRDPFEATKAPASALFARNAATLISSHILDTLTTVCDRISVLKDGTLRRTYVRAEFAELERESKLRLEVDVEGLLG